MASSTIRRDVLRGAGRARADRAGRRAGRVRPRRRLRGRPRALQRARSTRSRAGRRAPSSIRSRPSSTARSSRRATTSIVPAPGRHRVQLLRQGARRAASCRARVHAGEPWADIQGMTDVCLNPAACYPVYPSFTGALPEGGRTDHDAELGLPPRALDRADAHAGVPRARVRARRHARRGGRVARHVAAARPRSCCERSACRRRPTWPRIRSSAAAARCSPTARASRSSSSRCSCPVISPRTPTAVLLVQLPPGPLRRGVRDPDRATARSAHTACLGFGLERVRDGAVQTPRLRSRRRGRPRVRAQLWP